MSIFAWRYWWTDNEKDSSGTWTIELAGSRGITWPIDQPLHAWCHICSQINTPIHVPNEFASCGIYALTQPDSITWRFKNKHLGVVELWGKIIVAEFGYRAEYGQLRALVDVPSEISETYKVPNLPSIEYAKKEFFS
jgi:hypothetical protein